MKQSTETTIRWGNQIVTVSPFPKSLLARLRLRKRVLVPDEKRPWIRNMAVQVEDLFELSPDGQTLATHQGFMDRIREFHREKGIPYRVFDDREELPNPHIGSMGGFRFGQRELLLTALAKNRSGIIKAPTRYGKSALIKNTLRGFRGVRSVVALPGVDLCKQFFREAQAALPERSISLICSGIRTKYQNDDITICSVDSLDKCDAGATKLLLADEPHALVTEGRAEGLCRFTNARRLAFGATIVGRFDKADEMLEGIFGPVLAERTFLEGVKEGAICMITAGMICMPTPDIPLRTREAALERGLYLNPAVRSAIHKVLKEYLPPDFQSLVFIENEKQAEFLCEGLDGVIAMAKRLTDKQRDVLFARLVSGEIKRCVASKIYAQGVTFSHLRAVFNARGGGASTASIQIPGRVAELIPGKNRGLLFDILWKARPNGVGQGHHILERESLARLKAYQETGYEIHEIRSPSDLVNLVLKA